MSQKTKPEAPSTSPKGESHVSASTVRSLHSPLGELEGALGGAGGGYTCALLTFYDHLTLRTIDIFYDSKLAYSRLIV